METSALLPLPKVPLDGAAALFALLAEANRVDAKGSRAEIQVKVAEREAQRASQKAALEAAERAAAAPKGFFDAMGIGSLVGVATANPLLVMADISMHMSRLTPAALRDFEREHAGSIELATKVYCAAMNAAVLQDGLMTPEAYRAATALGGLLVQETEVLGEDASAWVGAGMVTCGSVDRAAAAATVVADKDSAVAETIREVDHASLEYTQYVALLGMCVAGAGAVVATGSSAAPVVAIAIALSVGGLTVQKTEALDGWLGKGASMWVGGGMMLSGSVVLGCGAAGAASGAAKALMVAGSATESAAQVHSGAHEVERAVVQYEVDEAHRVAQKHMNDAQRLLRQVDAIVDAVSGDQASFRRIAECVQGVFETEAETRLIIHGVRA